MAGTDEQGVGRRMMVGHVIRLSMILEERLGPIAVAEEIALRVIGNQLRVYPRDADIMHTARFAAYGMMSARVADGPELAGVVGKLIELAHIAAGECDEPSVDRALDELDALLLQQGGQG